MVLAHAAWPFWDDLFRAENAKRPNICEMTAKTKIDFSILETTILKKGVCWNLLTAQFMIESFNIGWF